MGPHGRSWRWLTILAGITLLASGCGTGSASDDAVTPGTVDPTLTTLAEAVDPMLREEFPDTFGGIELDHSRRTLTVYRLPDADLEARVRDLAGSVTVEFRDADFALRDMEAVVARVTADIEWWRSVGVDVNGAAPEPDASGVVVYVSSFDTDDAQPIEDQYAPMRVTVQERTAVAPIGSAPPTVLAPTGALDETPDLEE